jgi:hypothetical protein
MAKKAFESLGSKAVDGADALQGVPKLLVNVILKVR